jgi:hypothetical protein
MKVEFADDKLNALKNSADNLKEIIKECDF